MIDRCTGKPGSEKVLAMFADRTAEPAVAWRVAAVRFHGATRYDLAAEARHNAIRKLGGASKASPDDRTFLAELLLQAYLAKVSVLGRHIDQQFLGSVVWPSIRHHVFIHDDCFGVQGARTFPPYGRLPKDQHVGMNISAATSDGQAD